MEMLFRAVLCVTGWGIMRQKLALIIHRSEPQFCEVKIARPREMPRLGRDRLGDRRTIDGQCEKMPKNVQLKLTNVLVRIKAFDQVLLFEQLSTKFSNQVAQIPHWYR